MQGLYRAFRTGLNYYHIILPARIRREKKYLDDQLKGLHREEAQLIERIKDIDLELEDLKITKIPVHDLLPDNLKKLITAV